MIYVGSNIHAAWVLVFPHANDFLNITFYTYGSDFVFYPKFSEYRIKLYILEIVIMRFGGDWAARKVDNQNNECLNIQPGFFDDYFKIRFFGLGRYNYCGGKHWKKSHIYLFFTYLHNLMV